VPVESRTCFVTRSTAMIGEDMGRLDDAMKDERHAAQTRRAWLAHCTVLAAAIGAPGLVRAATAAASAAPAASSSSATRRILVVGDSLSAEYGLARGKGWVALLQQRVAQQAPRYEVVNASISGDTTAGGRSRLPTLLSQQRPAIVILELGGNDALRGLPLESTRANLVEMARLCRAAGAKVVLAGMQLPPNYGRRYSDDFAALYPAIAKSDGDALVPFLLHGVADGPQADTMFQPDRIHPTADAHPLILDNVWPVLKPLLR